MQSFIQTYLNEAKIGRKQSYRNLAVFPLLSGYAADLEYITLDEALTEDLIEVREKDEAGSVPELKVLNKSPNMVLILDGEELVGAKQSRIVNTTILVQGKSTTVIPVSCVEQGRWAYESRAFSSENRLMAAQLRAKKSEQVHRSIRRSDGFRSDQSEIWDEISSKALRSKVTKFLETAEAATVESRPSVGLGMDCRLESRNLNGFALAHEDRILHLSVFARSNGHREEPYRSRIQRFSNRRRYRR